MGGRTERLLVEDIEEVGYPAIKVDIRGGAGFTPSHDAGDIMAGGRVDPGRFAQPGAPLDVGPWTQLWIIEEKYKSTDANKYLQFDQEEVDSMIEFAEAWGATPVLACRWSSQLEWSPGATHYLKDARDVRRTDSGNVSVSPDRDLDDWQTTDRYFGGDDQELEFIDE